mmetsp:Transcript_65007/g.107781  ORF Transcript_65007/g.107781 Transcript_65007/m.107781 type:complete len:388 (-) Transcript_65007:71-1234(-)
MTTSVPLEDLQGEWVASRGEVINVQGNDLSINGKKMPGGLKVSKDGQSVVGFGIYEVNEGSGRDKIVWLAGFQEIIWRRPAEGEVKARSEFRAAQTASVGHGLAASANSGGNGWGLAGEQQAVAQLNALIQRWREGPLVRVRSCDICPDWTNRAQTGLSLDHVHYIATLMQRNGFKSRRRGARTEDGAHDVPVLIRESADSTLGKGALEKWRSATTEKQGFPRFLLEGQTNFFCSLGNGHFSQALNLFRTNGRNLWTDHIYDVGSDEALQEALDDGVESVVLSQDMPIADRRFVSEMLNKSNGRKWLIDDDGQVRVDDKGPAAMAGSQFVALSKVLDAEELSCLVRQKLGLDVDGNLVDKKKPFIEKKDFVDPDVDSAADGLLKSRL